MIKVLSLPSRHPYTSKFHQSGEIVFVNPETDYFNHIGGEPTPEFIDAQHPKYSYDLVHIHFSFDKISLIELENLLNYFDKINKPVVWTCHSRESQRKRGLGNGELQKLLYTHSKALITPTNGCRNWLINTFGNNKNIEVIPLGYMTAPNMVLLHNQALGLKKKTNFVYLVGDMRENKEINSSIDGFLKSPDLSDCVLTVITKPIPKNTSGLDNRKNRFFNTIQSSPRIKIISQPEVSNSFLTEIFCKQHVCMLPYLWGTHSGQIELAKDCGCHSVISNVGFYKEQTNEIIEFEFNNDISIFTNNLVESLILAKKAPLLLPQTEFRTKEACLIIEKHVNLYKKILEINNHEQK